MLTKEDKLEYLKKLIRNEEFAQYKVMIDIRMSKRQLFKANGDVALKINQQIDNMQKMLDGGIMYCEFLQEVMEEVEKDKIRGDGN